MVETHTVQYNWRSLWMVICSIVNYKEPVNSLALRYVRALVFGGIVGCVDFMVTFFFFFLENWSWRDLKIRVLVPTPYFGISNWSLGLDICTCLSLSWSVSWLVEIVLWCDTIEGEQLIDWFQLYCLKKICSITEGGVLIFTWSNFVVEIFMHLMTIKQILDL